jgi:hypothetical protein
MNEGVASTAAPSFIAARVERERLGRVCNPSAVLDRATRSAPVTSPCAGVAW